MFELTVDESYANDFRAFLIKCAETEDLARAEKEAARVLDEMAEDFKDQFKQAGITWFADNPDFVGDLIGSLQGLAWDVLNYLDDEHNDAHYEFFSAVDPMVCRLSWEPVRKLTGISCAQDWQALKRDYLDRVRESNDAILRRLR